MLATTERVVWHCIRFFLFLPVTSFLLKIIKLKLISHFRLSLDNTDDEGNEIKGQVVSIDTGSPVNSAGFGSGTPENQLADPPQRQYWTRFDFSNKELVFATGHVNGRIRIWDVYTGKLNLNFVSAIYILKFKILFAFFSGVKRAQVARADGSHAGCS